MEAVNPIQNYWNLGHSRTETVRGFGSDSQYVQLQIHHADDIGILSTKADFLRGTEFKVMPSEEEGIWCGSLNAKKILAVKSFNISIWMDSTLNLV